MQATLVINGDAGIRRHADATGVFGNRLAFDEAVSREVSRTRRSGAALSLLALEVDDLQSADETLLGAVSETIASQVREPDLCFQWGGGEFFLLLPETSRRGAMELARRLRGVCAAEHRLPDGQPLRLTAGLAQLGPDQDGAGLLQAADTDLLHAKQADAGPAPGVKPPLID